MCLRPMLETSCKGLLRFSVTTTGHMTPGCALESSTFHANQIIKPYLKPASPFSTDSKKQKKKKQDDQSSSKHVNRPFEKKKFEPYTDKQDKLILERVREKGYDNPETWKSLAIDFNMKWPYSIKVRCDLILKRGSGERQKPKMYTEEEDALIVQKVEEGGYDNIDTWKMLAIELDRDPTHHSIIRDRYDLIIDRDTKETKRFTEEDNIFILTYVEKNGDSKTTWQELATKLGVDHPHNIRSHYHNLLQNFVKGKFTKEEDKIILNYVKINGNNTQTFRKLRKELNRGHLTSIRTRFEYLQNKPSKKRSSWQIEEDMMLMEHFFQVNDRFHQFLNTVLAFYLRCYKNIQPLHLILFS